MLTHGAGSDRNHQSLVAIEKKMAPLPVERMNFAYVEQGRKFPPDRAPRLIESILSLIHI